MANIPDLIRKKRDGGELSKQDINSFVSQVVDGTLQESQIGAMLMAMYLQKLTNDETVALTSAMVSSGEVLQWEETWNSLLVDKHSTGGVGDKVSLILAPALAATGLKVPMVSGRGLEFTGGTLDKLESIPGFRVQLSKAEMHNALRVAGCFIAGATASLAPADMILYKTRDVTATVDSISLIAASIVSKKVAEGTRALVMDIKVGRGAFFKDVATARLLASKIINVSAGLGLPTRAVITRMDAPLGRTVGNALEVVEAIECLRGGGPPDLLEVVVTLGGVVLEMKRHVKTLEQGKAAILQAIKSGRALQHFQTMLECQGVMRTVAFELCHGKPWNVLPCSPKIITKLSIFEAGVVSEIDSDAIARACWHLGAGRSFADQPIEPKVGVILLVRIGESVTAGQHWIEVHHVEDKLDGNIQETLDKAIVLVKKLKKSNSSSVVVEIM